MSDVAELSAQEANFLLVMRRLEQIWRSGHVGNVTVHMAKNGDLRLEGKWFEDLGDMRREADRRSAPRDGEDRRKTG